MAKINWDGIGKMISDTADTVSRKTGEVVELTKLKNQVYSLEREMKKSYEELGKKLYEHYTEEGTIDSEYVEICEEIARREIVIAEYEGEIENLKKEM